MLVLASSIDDAMDDIHPKVLKRVRVGPIVSPRFSKEDGTLLVLLKQYGKEDDLAIHIQTEIIRSAKQVVKKGFFQSGKVREIFALPDSDAECLEKGVSALARYVIIPHSIYQHSTNLGLPKIQAITYNQKGRLTYV